MSWREYAQRRQWESISISKLSVQEMFECLEILASVLPNVTRGDGVETYIDKINSNEAQGMEEYHASSLFHQLRRRYEIFTNRKGLGQPFRDEVSLAIQSLREVGIEYEGMHETYLYLDSDGDWIQLEGDVGKAILARDDSWEEELFFQEREGSISIRDGTLELRRRRDLYPWRYSKMLHTWWKIGFFPENSKVDHAICLLDSYRQFQSKLLGIVSGEGFLEASFGNRGRRAADAIHLSRDAYWIGREYEAILKKEYEPHAVRGLKTIKGAQESAKAINAKHAKMRNLRFRRMEHLVPALGVDRAAAQCETEGLGKWESIKRQWNRYKKGTP